MAKIGRPTKYTPELADRICELIAAGKSERKIARMKGMPTPRTMSAWKDENPDFLRRSARAREESAALFQEEALSVARELSAAADKALTGELTCKVMVDGQPCDVFRSDLPRGYVESKKALIDQLVRESALRDDRNFSDRKAFRHEGPNGGPVQIETGPDLSRLSKDQLLALESILYGEEN